MRVGEHDRASRRRQHTPAGAVGAAAADGEAGADEKGVQPAPKWYLLAARVSERVLACFFFPDAFGTAGSSRFPGSVLHPGRSLAPQARLNPAFQTLLALQVRLDLAFWTLLAPPARLDPPVRTLFAPQARWLDSLRDFLEPLDTDPGLKHGFSYTKPCTDRALSGPVKMWN